MSPLRLFENDIKRDINGVIKVGQLTDKDVRQELVEYVLTRELRKYFTEFYQRYTDSMDTPTDKTGVWISGFFGSGKSHLLKILAYLLENRAVDGLNALGYFEPKVSDAMLFGRMERAGNAPNDVILFNIDSKAEASSKSDKEAIVKVFMRVFDDHLGYFGASPEIADFERRLAKQGRFEAFKGAYQRVQGASWVEDRENWDFREDQITQCLQEVLDMTPESARKFFDRFGEAYTLSVEGFAKIVKEYLDSKPPQHRVVFMVDEVGQYIGENNDLMLNLQTIAEDLGTHCDGRAWIVVTSQEDIDSITQNRVKGDDFSKIQGRFKTRLSLSSANTDEVIKLRLLEKTEEANHALHKLFEEKDQVLRNQIRFSAGTADMPGYRNGDDFSKSYPFVPYQFTLLQKVFTQIRIHGASGKHLAQGERSMLDAFQIAAQLLNDKPLGSLAPFHLFYQAVEGFLDASVKTVITQAADNARLQPEDVDLLKTLFMIKYVKEIKGTAENLSTLELAEIDEDRVNLQKRIEASLARLESETLIQRNGDVFEFLTNEEQDVGREIKNFTVNPGEVPNELQGIIWGEIYDTRKYRYDRRHDYGFNRKLDGVVYGGQTDDLTLHLVTPDGDEYGDLRDDRVALMRSGNGTTAIVRLPDERSAFDDLIQFVKTDRYLTQKTGNVSSASVKAILQARADENRTRRQRVVDTLRHLVIHADIFVKGTKLDLNAGSAKDVLDGSLRALVENTFTKLSYIQSPFDSDEDIERALRDETTAQTLDGQDPNARAQQEMHHWLTEQQARHQTVTLRVLEGHFGGSPYGWAKRDVDGVLAELLARGKAELKRAQASVDLQEPGLIGKMTSKQGLDSYTVRVPRVVDQGALLVARQLAQDALGFATVPSEAQNLYERYRQVLETKIASVRANLERARQGNYPFKDKLEAHEGLLSRLLAASGAAVFFDELKANRNEFEDLVDEAETIGSFYRDQIEHFDEARGTLEALGPELEYVDEADLTENLDKVRAILLKDDPTNDVPSLAGLLSPVAKRVEALRGEYKEEALQSWQNACDQVAKLVANEGLPESDRDRLLQPMEGLKEDISKAASIDAAVARKARVEQVRDQVERAIIERINTLAGDPGQAEVRPIEVVRPAKLASKTTLETKSDIDEYVDGLRKELQRAFEAGNRIRLE